MRAENIGPVSISTGPLSGGVVQGAQVAEDRSGRSAQVLGQLLGPLPVDDGRKQGVRGGVGGEFGQSGGEEAHVRGRFLAVVATRGCVDQAASSLCRRSAGVSQPSV
ncbi:hypothetical protein ADL27_40940, partial [Streptomyces sp. NRRL F-6602]